MASTGRYTERTIGGQPKREETPKETDAETERIRLAAKGHPYAKKYGKDEWT